MPLKPIHLKQECSLLVHPYTNLRANEEQGL